MTRRTIANYLKEREIRYSHIRLQLYLNSTNMLIFEDCHTYANPRVIQALRGTCHEEALGPVLGLIC